MNPIKKALRAGCLGLVLAAALAGCGTAPNADTPESASAVVTTAALVPSYTLPSDDLEAKVAALHKKEAAEAETLAAAQITPAPTNSSAPRASATQPPTKQPAESPEKTQVKGPRYTIAGTIAIPYEVSTDSGDACGGLQDYVLIQKGTDVSFTDSRGRSLGAGEVVSCRWRDTDSSFNIPGQADYAYHQPIMYLRASAVTKANRVTMHVAGLSVTLSWAALHKVVGATQSVRGLDVKGCKDAGGLCLTDEPFPTTCPAGMELYGDRCIPDFDAVTNPDGTKE